MRTFALTWLALRRHRVLFRVLSDRSLLSGAYWRGEICREAHARAQCFIGGYLASGSPYVDTAESEKERDEQVKSIFLAAGFYLTCAAVSGYYWSMAMRGSQPRRRRQPSSEFGLDLGSPGTSTYAADREASQQLLGST